MRLVRSVTANFTAALSELGSSIVLLSLKELSTIPSNDLKKVLKNLGPTVRWTQCQLHTLVKKELGDKKVSLQRCWKLASHMLLFYTYLILLPFSVKRWRVKR